jgi:hypothetical protein
LQNDLISNETKVLKFTKRYQPSLSHAALLANAHTFVAICRNIQQAGSNPSGARQLTGITNMQKSECAVAANAATAASIPLYQLAANG